MTTVQLTIQTETGLHARPATLFVSAAKKYSSTITVEKSGMEGDAKRFLKVLSLSILKGDTITLKADGPDEKEAIDALSSLIKNDFK